MFLKEEDHLDSLIYVQTKAMTYELSFTWEFGKIVSSLPVGLIDILFIALAMLAGYL